MTRTLAVLTLVLSAACGKAEAPPSAKQDASKTKPATKAEAKAGTKEPAPDPQLPPGPPVNTKDPPWFRPGIIEGTTLSKQGRSDQNQNMMLLEFENKTTAEECIAKVTEKLQAHVPLVSATGTGREGQLTVKGNTEAYRVTVVCGEAEGTMRAFLGYEWIL